MINRTVAFLKDSHEPITAPTLWPALTTTQSLNNSKYNYAFKHSFTLFARLCPRLQTERIRNLAWSCLELKKLGHSPRPLVNTGLLHSSSGSHLHTDTHTHILRSHHTQGLRQSCTHRWFVPRFQDSAYCNRKTLFFISAYLMCVTWVACRLCINAWPPHCNTGPHSSSGCVFVWMHNVARTGLQERLWPMVS